MRGPPSAGVIFALRACTHARMSVLKANSTSSQSPKRKLIGGMQSATIGVDLADKSSRYCVIDGKVVAQGGMVTTREAISEKFGDVGRCRVALEVGTHSRG
jgi:hypothetical protein